MLGVCIRCLYTAQVLFAVVSIPSMGPLPTACMLTGFLPFSAIYIELYYIFASVWGHKVYTIYSILFIVFIILLVVTAFITIALTYFQLAVEDHTWWWRSFLCGGSTGQPLLSTCLTLRVAGGRYQMALQYWLASLVR